MDLGPISPVSALSRDSFEEVCRISKAELMEDLGLKWLQAGAMVSRKGESVQQENPVILALISAL